MQAPLAKRVALEELQAALEVVTAAAPQPRLLVALEELVAAMGGMCGSGPPAPSAPSAAAASSATAEDGPAASPGSSGGLQSEG